MADEEAMGIAANSSRRILPDFRGILWRENGGAEGDRTPDLMTASHALSQLSYGPKLY